MIKINELNELAVIDNSKKCKFSGITEGYITSLGVVTAKIFLKNHFITLPMHVVEEDFPLPASCILGDDFLNKYKCVLDYEQKKLKINITNNVHETLRFLNNPKQFFSYTIPARCQVIRYIPHEVSEPTVVHQQQIADGVFVSNTIISPESQFIQILNINMKPETIRPSEMILKTSPLKNYNIVEKSAQNRCEKVRSLIEKNVPLYAKSSLLPLIDRYSDVFALDSEKLSTNNIYKQKIRLSDTTPVYKRNYRLPEAQKSIIHDEIKKLLSDDIIEPSSSPYNSPILLVPKKSVTGKPAWRLVVDYRDLNKKVIPDKFPLPRIDDILDQLGRAKHFSVLDLQAGFHQIELEESSRDVTSFSSDSGSYRFKRVPFGLSISPSGFSRLMGMAFSGLPPQTCFLYVDDLIVAACSVKQHLKKLEYVFETCRKFNLKLNPNKSKFFQKSVTFLGHLCTEDGILPDPAKFEPIKNYPVPENADQARRFVAFANYYRRFIKNFAEMARPINNLTKKKVKFHWTPECQKSLEDIRQCLMSPPILRYPDFKKVFTITTDASNIACGATLSQEYNGTDLPVSYYSRAFTKGEKNKTTIEKELLAIYFAIEHFRPYVYGRHFKVKSDHRPLVHLFSLRKASSRLTRIRLELEEYDFEVIYVPGRDNVTADALSRITIAELKGIENCIAVITRAQAKKQTVNESTETYPTIRPRAYEMLNNNSIIGMPQLKFKIKEDFSCTVCRKRQQLFEMDLHKFLDANHGKLDLQVIFKVIDSEMKKIGVNELVIFKDDEIFRHFKFETVIKTATSSLKNTYLVVAQAIIKINNPDEQKKLIKLYHEDPILGGHCGQQRLLAKLRSKYAWRHMAKSVNNYVRSCHQCQINKAMVKNKPLSVITPTPQNPFDIVLFDLVGPFPTSIHGNKYAITIICELTKYVVIIPIPNKEAKVVAQAIVDHFILIYGPMPQVRTDGGKENVNEIFSNIAKLFEINHAVSAPYHPSTIAPCERNHRVLNSYLRTYINPDRTDWDIFAKYYALMWNISPSPLLENYTPFELVFNKKANFPDTLHGVVQPLYNDEDIAKTTKYRFQWAHERAKTLLEDIKKKQKISLDQNAKLVEFAVGESVLITKCDRTKLDPFYQGPYKISKIEYPNALLEIDGKCVKIHLERLKKYYS